MSMIINWRLAKHPMNYVIITLMLVIAGIAGHLVLTWIGVMPAEAPMQPQERNTPATTPVKLNMTGSTGSFQAVNAGA